MAIERDGYGTPYVMAESDPAVYFGFGYAQAESHDLELLFLALQVEGRLAEVFGPDCLKSDLRVRDLGFARDAERVVAALPPPIREGVLRPFGQGIDAGIEARPALPAWAERAGSFGPERVAAIALFYQFMLATANDPHGFGGFVGEAPWHGDVGRRAHASMSSNAFAIAGSRTRSKAPIVGAVPHLGLRHPYLLIEAGLKGPSVDVHGFTFLGLPLPIFGFTPGTAWGVTIDTVDSFDRTYEALRPGPIPAVRRADGWRPLTLRAERVKVAGQPDVSHVVREGDRGPLVLDLGPDAAIALNWGGRGEGAFIEQLHAMALARDLDAFEAALAKLGTPNYAFTAADTRGGLLFAHAGRAPERASRFTADGGPIGCGDLDVDTVTDTARPLAPCGFGQLPGIPGWAEGGARIPEIAYAALPRERDPLSGWTQSANTPPHAHTKPSRVPECPGDSIAPCRDDPSYKQNDRGRRLSERLDALRDATLDEAVAIFLDSHIASAETQLPALFAAWRSLAAGMSPGHKSRLARAIDILGAWNLKADASSRGAALYHFYASALGPPVAHAIDPERRIESLGAAVDHLERHFGRIDPSWSDVHRLRRAPSPLRAGASVELGAAGGAQTLGALHALDPSVAAFAGSAVARTLRRNPGHPGPEVADFGTGAVMVVELGRDGPSARTALIFGTDDDPASPHFADQARQLIGADRLKPVPFSRNAIRAASVRRVALRP